MITILGGGLAGISCSHHLKHENCEIFEQHAYLGGHIHNEVRDGFTWDEGPHVSFTKHEYVRELFAESTEYHEYPVFPTNYYKGNWVPHPAQSNLFALPEEVKQKCVDDFLAKRRETENTTFVPLNYKEWLNFAFGESFSNIFPSVYTAKYWTTSPENLTTDWVGGRVFFPKVEDVVKGSIAPLENSTHYITSIRYPKQGGYFSFAKRMASGVNVHYGKKMSFISFAEKVIQFSDGTNTTYTKLISTIPLPILIQQSDAPIYVKQAASELSCSSVLLVNIVAEHPTQRTENWIYVYDEDKYSSRINCTELLSPANGIEGKTGVQVEVYFSKYRPLDKSPAEVMAAVCDEMIEMGLIKSKDSISSTHSKWVEWANVIFDHPRKSALTIIYGWLEQFGLEREVGDLEPMTDWVDVAKNDHYSEDATLFLAGRFGQWNYFWTDDCVMRGKYLGERIKQY